METLEENDSQAFAKQFSRYIKEGVTADKIEDMYTNAHKAIRANPAREKKDKKFNTVVKGRRAPMSRQQRADRVKQKMAAFERKIASIE